MHFAATADDTDVPARKRKGKEITNDTERVRAAKVHCVIFSAHRRRAVLPKKRSACGCTDFCTSGPALRAPRRIDDNCSRAAWLLFTQVFHDKQQSRSKKPLSTYAYFTTKKNCSLLCKTHNMWQ
ncbi:hypothetical protein V5799_028471 [Amblyomma americanum]|uniref:Uncharacterized protein n=1 Tax=Amblyomma americanum TaxID=6943 RepID=A0AAQ4DCS0_AMBAM